MPKPPMRSSTASSHKAPTATHTYPPSVPLSVYRELAVQLQAAEARLDSLNTQNQQLARQNQQLRQEIEKAVHSVLHLQKVVDSTGAVKQTSAYHPTKDFGFESSRPASGGSRSTQRSSQPPTVQSAVEGSFPFPARKAGSVFSEKVFTEEEEGRYSRRSQSKPAAEVSGWFLAIAIVFITLAAFSAGYLIVRPLLQNR